MENKLIQLTEDEFDKTFNLINNHLDNNASFSGKMFETYGEELDFVTEMAKQNRVITIIEGDADDDDDDDDDDDVEEDEEGYKSPAMYYSSGMHRVNRIGFLVTDKPFEIEFEVKLD